MHGLSFNASVRCAIVFGSDVANVIVGAVKEVVIEEVLGLGTVEVDVP